MSASDLQFEHAEFGTPAAAQSCANCKQSATPQYYELNGKVFCASCRQGIEASLDKMRTNGSLWRGLLYGFGAAVAGAIVFYAVLALSGFQFGLIAVVIGWAVGKAVRKGSRSLGGRKYQIMAVLLTYFSIASTNVPLIFKFAGERAHKVQAAQAANSSGQAVSAPVQRPKPNPAMALVGLLLIFGVALAIPILSITHNPLTVIIIGIGLWEAWKFTRAIKIEFKGPFTVASAPSA